MITAFVIIFIAYFLVITWCLWGFYKLPIATSEKQPPKTHFTIIVSFRNEAEQLPNLLQSLSAIDYPKDHFEILFINDASEDKGEEIIKEYFSTITLPIQYSILQNNRVSAAPKKDAITRAIKDAQNPWIVTTDADCQVPSKWLQLANATIQKLNPTMICGPILFETDGSLLGSFQLLEGLSLQGVTMGAFGWNIPLLANGANLMYKKEAFIAVQGYEGNNHIASGDDVFLLEKIQEHYSKQVHFLKHKEAAVITQGETNLRAVVAQRVRWAAKTSEQKRVGTKLIGAITFLANVFFILALFGIANGRYHNYEYSSLCTAYVFQKIVLDLLLVTLLADFFKKPFSIFHFLGNAFLYPMVTVWVVIKSFFGGYEWKGRIFQK